jgi:hypothetical protein
VYSSAKLSGWRTLASNEFCVNSIRLPHSKAEEKGHLNLRSDRGRVQFALGLYLTVFVGLNLLVWTWFVIHRHGPHHFPLGERAERFGDLLHFSLKYQIGSHHRMEESALKGTLFPKNYPPFAVGVYLFLLQVCAPYALVVLLFVILSGIAAACTLLWRRARRASAYRWYVGAAIFATGLFGWGTEQILIRANIEGLVWIATCLGAFLFFRRRYNGSAVSFAIACCLKPQGVLWLLFMARQRKYRSVMVGIVTGALVTLGSLMTRDRNPLRAYRSSGGESRFFEDYVVSFRPVEEAKVDHSLLQSMKMICRVFRFHGFDFPKYERVMLQSSNALAYRLYHAYLPVAIALGLLVAWKVWNKPILNQMFAVACVTTVLPMIAADYTLNILMVPMGFLLLHLLEDVAEGRVQMTTGRILWFVLPCAWIMAAQPLWTLHGVLKCLAVLILLGASVSIELPTSLFGEIGRTSYASATE